jgi:PAS domain S-box-containing protein
MEIILSLLNPFPYISMPSTLVGWLGWFISFALFILLIWRGWEGASVYKLKTWVIFFIFTILTPFTTWLIGVRLLTGFGTIETTLNSAVTSPALMLFTTLPWVLTGGILGPGYAAILGAFSGLLLGLYETHNLFSLVEIGIIAFLFSKAVRQLYRTRIFGFIRHPIGAAVMLMVFQIPLLILTSFFAVNGSLASRLDFAFTQTWPMILTRSVELLIGGIIGEILYQMRKDIWGVQGELVPSPSETNLQLRFLYGSVPYILVLVFILIITDWVVAVRASRNMVEEQLANASLVASDSLPFFFETGQDLILTYATEDLVQMAPEDLSRTLATRYKSVKFFSQLFVFRADGTPILGFPSNDINLLNLSSQEKAGMAMAQQGRLIQVFTVPPRLNGLPADVSFMAAIRDSQGNVKGILLGRSDLTSNHFTSPAIRSMQSVAQLGGEGMILDENQTILYHTNSSMIMQAYYGSVEDDEKLYNDISSTGESLLAYYRKVPDSTWSILLAVPAEQSQEVAMSIAVPLLLMIIVIGIIAFVGLRFALRGVLSTINSLGDEALRIANGQLDHELTFSQEDEVGKLGKTFDQMRVSLKARLEELNRLLVVSQGVAGNLQVQDAMRPILEAALLDSSGMVRVVLVSETTLDNKDEKRISFGLGETAHKYAYLDSQIFDLMRNREVVSVPNTQRWKGVQFDYDTRPGAIYAFALHRENQYFGVLWVGFRQPKVITEPEIQFINTLAGLAAIAASNASLYANAEIGRQRLEAVLTSTPEPVLVTDEQNRLFLLNPAAIEVSGLLRSALPGLPLADVVMNQELLTLFHTVQNRKIASKEIIFPNDKVFYASVAPIMSEDMLVGKICILRDITSYKVLDKLKSELVENVSHDFRSPLTLMRGYATMLQMVGPLNEQQTSYVNKITTSVDKLSDLVTNLLDLSRIEAGAALKFEKVVVEEIIEQVTASLQPQAAQKKIVLNTSSLKDSKNIIEADRSLLTQAIYNLVDNGIKYTGTNGTVTAKVVSEPSKVIIEIYDTGIGISPIDLPHMFEKFYRSDRRESFSQRGTGLGLAIVSTIVERHGGKPKVTSSLGKGSCFSIELPRYRTVSNGESKADYAG